MTINVTLLVVMGVLFATGLYQLTERSLTRVLLGIILVGNAVNLLILFMGGQAGLAPLFSKGTPAQDYSDPLPQAMILTAIVITFAVTAFMLGLIYRSWWLSKQDEVQDDTEDRRVAEDDGWDPEEDADLPLETSEFGADHEPEHDDDTDSQRGVHTQRGADRREGEAR